MVGLGDLPGGSFGSYSQAVSADGSTVVGFGNSVSGGEAFRWTFAEGMVGLGDFPGGSSFSVGNDVSADGSIVVGRGQSASGSTAFIWDETNGMRNLADVLANEFGLDLTGWDLREATGISDDGRTIVGYGFNPNDDLEAWVAVVPEPCSFVLAAFAFVSVCVVALRRRHNSH